MTQTFYGSVVVGEDGKPLKHSSTGAIAVFPGIERAQRLATKGRVVPCTTRIKSSLLTARHKRTAEKARKIRTNSRFR